MDNHLIVSAKKASVVVQGCSYTLLSAHVPATEWSKMTYFTTPPTPIVNL